MVNGNRLKLSIKGSGLSMEKAAEKMGISRTTLYSYFTMAEVPDDAVQNVKQKLGIDLSEPAQPDTNSPTPSGAGASDPVMYQEVVRALIKAQDELIESGKSQRKMADAQIEISKALLDERQQMRAAAINLSKLEERAAETDTSLDELETAVVYGLAEALKKSPQEIETRLHTKSWKGADKSSSGKKTTTGN